MSDERDPPRFLPVDIVLSRRLEAAEANANLDYVETRARLDPSSGACSMERAGIRALFDGVGSPMTQTFGLGLFGNVLAEDLTAIEEFFCDRGAEVLHEVSPLADGATMAWSNGRNYHPLELSTVLFRPLEPDVMRKGNRREEVKVRVAKPSEADRWAGTAARGWAIPELTAFFESVGRVTIANRHGTAFFAEIDGRPVATAALSIHEGVALLAGASTIPEFRGRGAQLALLDHRLRYAAERGCDLASMATEPGSASQRNSERQGFRIAYTRTKWRKGDR